MNDNIPSETIDSVEKDTVKAEHGPLISEMQIFLVTILFSPLAGLYFLRYNFIQLNQLAAAKKCAMAIVLVAIALCVFMMGVSEALLEHIPPFVIPAASAGCLLALLKQYQGETIKAWFESGGRKYSWWKLLGIGLLLLIFWGLVIFFIIFLVSTVMMLVSPGTNLLF